jgi:hypothetical protein
VTRNTATGWYTGTCAVVPVLVVVLVTVLLASSWCEQDCRTAGVQAGLVTVLTADGTVLVLVLVQVLSLSLVLLVLVE